MSALNVTQAEADVLIAGLKMYATVQQNASGVVPDEVATLLAKLAPEPEPVVEEPAAVEAFLDEVPHEQFTHEDDVVQEVEEETSTRKKKAK